MKNLLKQLGLTSGELSKLLFVHESTIRSWLHRGRNPKTSHYIYFQAMENCIQNFKSTDRDTLEKDLEDFAKDALEEKRSKTIRELKINLERGQLQLEKLLKKQEQAFLRWHVSQKISDYLPEGYTTDEHTATWSNWIGKKSRLKLKELLLERKHLEQRLLTLETAISYWEKN